MAALAPLPVSRGELIVEVFLNRERTTHPPMPSQLPPRFYIIVKEAAGPGWPVFGQYRLLVQGTNETARPIGDLPWLEPKCRNPK